MPNIGSVLKSEIARVSRKELRSETEALKKSITGYRSQIAELKRRMQALEREVRQLARGSSRRAASSEPEGEDAEPRVRFSAKGFAAHRQRLGLSAAAMAKLLGVSALSVYKWESGNTRPRAKQLQAIAQLRRMGRREAQRRLEEM